VPNLSEDAEQPSARSAGDEGAGPRTAIDADVTEMNMSEHHSGAQTLERGAEQSADGNAALAWLRSEFPDWDVRIDRATTGDGRDRPVWIAQQEGHHPQSELTAGKLHTRLSDYHDRTARRNPSRN